ncbi:amino acid ABC transporter permease [Pseudomonas typographi]|uniref:Amino acid ABC transporter permease n=1 Tax=Pseudomonas typographi TaxID=2715964 RepID=A0ABR7Z2Z0_9PSED|nr:amino acid ABC transporter permease [Pseudomonas typographi]MBD1553116.1 amino acid ABC transporter permease [Pseudomonas typographi]MBD1585897.1 amino acid ABC transporter permease [Pseudomonas typographi]MBD1599737.1 amino acid ABC transporter permease [Pseudomonas typographi]
MSSYEWQFTILFQYWPIFLRGALTTLEITFAATALGLLIGLPVGVLRQARSRWVRLPVSVYVESIRATPALVQIVWIYYCFPILFGLQMSAEVTMIVALGIHTGAYVAEIVRAGINAVDRGQFAAAKSIGMSSLLALRRIILPQAGQKMIPPFINEFANIMKLSTLGSTIAVYELLQESNNLIATIYRPLEIYTFLALVFFLITYPWILLSQRFEARLQRRA